MLARQSQDRAAGALLDKIRARIARWGPLAVAEYMEACLGDREHGYYATRDPLGRDGDFITAPEVSQMFGELIGLWCAVVWRQMGAPEAVKLVELGPGRGTLMADALRAAATVPGFLEALEVHLVETSPALKARQAEMLSAAGVTPQWHASLGEVPEGTAIIIANEFLDALPVRQFELREGEWRERCVDLTADGRLVFGLLPEQPEAAELLPKRVRQAAQDGDIAEIRPGAEEIVRALAARAERHPVAALFIDYGHVESAPGDTLQAVRAHEYADPLAAPGEADLTAHVDFGAMGASAGAAGMAVHGPVTQGDFLLALGLNERCERLLRSAEEDDRSPIASGAARLADPAQMGRLFKVMALTSPLLAPPPFAPAGTEGNA